MTANLTWTCALHGPVAFGDCPHCDDEALALLDDSPTECLRDYFLAPDGANEPTLWRRNLDRPDYPTALVRRCDVGSEAVWRLIETHPEVAR